MPRFGWQALALCLALSTAALAQSSRKSATAPPKPYNQFVTVDEFIKAKRPAKTLVSVEGYVVYGRKAGSGEVVLYYVDSVDKIILVKEAQAACKSAARITVPSSFVSSSARRGWTDKGLRRFAMYIGASEPSKAIHDAMPKLRVTGRVATGRGIVSPATKVEYMDDNGDWKAL